MKRFRIIGVLLVAMVVATSCETYFDHQTVRVVQAQETAFWEDGDELMLATIDFRVQPGVPGSAEAHFNESSLVEVADRLRNGDVETISNSDGLYVFDDLEVASFQTILAGQAPDIVGQIVIGIENDGTPNWVMRGPLHDVADDLEDLLVDVIESRSIGELFADPDALIADLADAASLLQPETAWYEDLLLKIVSLGNDDDILNFNALVFIPVAPSLAPVVDAAFANLPDGFYGGAFPTEYDGETVPPKQFELRFFDHESDYRVTTFVGPGTAGVGN